MIMTVNEISSCQLSCIQYHQVNDVENSKKRAPILAVDSQSQRDQRIVHFEANKVFRNINGRFNFLTQ